MKNLIYFLSISLLLLCNISLFSQGNNPADANVNLALLGDATISGNVNGKRGTPSDILYDPATNAYAIRTNYNEYGYNWNENRDLATKGNGLNWQVNWTSIKTINYITFGGTYPNQPQPNTAWTISYNNGTSWIILEEGVGGWIDTGVYEWGGADQPVINAASVKVEIYSDGINPLVSAHIRARGAAALRKDDSDTNPKATLIQYLPPTINQSPPAPSGLVSTGTTESSVDLSWDAESNGTVAGYNVYVDVDNELIATLSNATTYYTVNGLISGTQYNFYVTAFNEAGIESAKSNVISVTTNTSSGGGVSSGNSPWIKSGSNVSVATSSDNVAIGRSTVPNGYKLAVDGNIRTREVRVDQDNWPDYVFDKDYDLPSLEEIQRYIKEKGHLPNIPSAKEVEQNGIELGEMNKLLLEKIEELTLYILDQERRINNQQKEIQLLKESSLKNNSRLLLRQFSILKLTTVR